MIEFGADPCALSITYLTPSMLALLRSLESNWVRALVAVGVDASAVCRHSFKTISKSSLGNLQRKPCYFVSRPVRPFGLSDLGSVHMHRQHMLDRFAARGICADSSWFEGADDSRVYAAELERRFCLIDYT